MLAREGRHFFYSHRPQIQQEKITSKKSGYRWDLYILAGRQKHPTFAPPKPIVRAAKGEA